MSYQCSTVSFGPRFEPRTAPLTFWLLVAAIVFWLGAFLAPPLRGLADLLLFRAETWTAQPWSLFTYPLVNLSGQPFFFLLMGYVFWWSGAETERWWGTRVHAVFLLTVSAVTALLLALGSGLLATGAAAMGLGIPLCAVLTVWSLRNLRTPIILMIVPAYGWVLLVVEVLTLWMAYGPALGLFALAGGVGLPAAYFYWGHHLHQMLKRNTRPPGRPQAPRSGRRDEAERKAREKRVADIFERSGLRVVDEDEPKPR